MPGNTIPGNMSAFARLLGHRWTLPVATVLFAVTWGALAAYAGIPGLAIAIAVTVLPVVLVLSAQHIRPAVYFITIVIYFSGFIERIFKTESLPIGVMTDAFILFLTLSVLIRTRELQASGFWRLLKHPVMVMIFINTGYMLLQAFNPFMFSMEGYFMGLLRSTSYLGVVLVSLFAFDTEKRMMAFLKFWVMLAILSAAYGFYQQWVGLPSFDSEWLFGDPRRAALMVLFGNIRIFSFLPEPSILGILLAIFALFLVVLLLGKRIRPGYVPLAIIGIVLMVLTMGYSGTRTAYALLPLGLVYLGLFKIGNIRTIGYLAVLGLILLFILYGPIYGNYTINRFRSAFRPNNDPSMQVRDGNRKAIQPYIWSHPIGGGVNTAGVTGMRYNPGHTLSFYPPDSGFLRAAMETGWIGLFLNVISYFVIVYTSITGYFKAKSPRIRMLYMGLGMMLFCFIASHFTQLVIGSFYVSMIYYPLIAMNIRLIEFDSENKPL